jgi:hypothetical protein
MLSAARSRGSRTLVAAVAAALRLPLVTGDRRVARAAGGLLVHDDV